MSATTMTPKAARRTNAAPYTVRTRAERITARTRSSDSVTNSTSNQITTEQSNETVASGTTVAGASQAPKVRVRWTDAEKTVLEELYTRNNGKPTKQQVEEIAEDLSRPPHSARIWIQNRRSKGSRGKRTRLSTPPLPVITDDRVEAAHEKPPRQQEPEPETTLDMDVAIPDATAEAVPQGRGGKAKSTSSKSAKKTLVPLRVAPSRKRVAPLTIAASVPEPARPSRRCNRRSVNSATPNIAPARASAPSPSPDPEAFRSSGTSAGSSRARTSSTPVYNTMRGLESAENRPVGFTDDDMQGADNLAFLIIHQYGQPGTQRGKPGLQ